MRGAHDQLVLGVDQGVGPGLHVHALADEGPQVLGGHVLVVEGDHVQAAGEIAQRVEVACSRRPGRWPRQRPPRRPRPRRGPAARSRGRPRRGPSFGRAGRRQPHRLQEKSRATDYRKPTGTCPACPRRGGESQLRRGPQQRCLQWGVVRVFRRPACREGRKKGARRYRHRPWRVMIKKLYGSIRGLCLAVLARSGQVRRGRRHQRSSLTTASPTS